MATRKSIITSGEDNTTLLERRFMFADRTVPVQRFIPTSSNFPMAPSVPSVPSVPSMPSMPSLPSSDYNIFLRSFDSNQRLSDQGSQLLNTEMAKYKALHENPSSRFHPVMTQTNFAYNPNEGLFTRQGEQTRYNSKKNENTQETVAARQYESSYTPQSIAQAASQIQSYAMMPQQMPMSYQPPIAPQYQIQQYTPPIQKLRSKKTKVDQKQPHPRFRG